MDLKQYWRTVARQREGLAVDVSVFYLTSVTDEAQSRKGGVVTELDREGAARALANQTHKHSTPEEIEQYHAEQKSRKAEIAQAEHDRKQQYALPKSLEALVESFIKNQGSGSKK